MGMGTVFSFLLKLLGFSGHGLSRLLYMAVSRNIGGPFLGWPPSNKIRTILRVVLWPLVFADSHLDPSSGCV